MSTWLSRIYVSEAVIEQAIKCKSVGFNSYTSDKHNPGEVGGGPAAAFIVRSMNPGHIVAVELRYLNPALNGGVKTQCQGEKDQAAVILALSAAMRRCCPWFGAWGRISAFGRT